MTKASIRRKRKQAKKEFRKSFETSEERVGKSNDEVKFVIDTRPAEGANPLLLGLDSFKHLNTHAFVREDKIPRKLSSTAKRRDKKRVKQEKREKNVEKANEIQDIPVYDAWSEDRGPVKKPKFGVPEIEDYRLRQIGEKGKKKPKSVANCRSLLPKDLVKQVVETEIRKEKQEEKIDKRIKLTKGAKYASQLDILNEMSEGLPGYKPPSPVKDEPKLENIDTYQRAPPTTTAENRKRTAKRKREERRKVEGRANDKRKETHKEEAMIYRLRSVKKEVRLMEEKAKQTQHKNIKKKLQKFVTVANNSNVRYTEPDLPVNLIEDMTPSLMMLKPEGDILHDQYKSLQKRNLIETRQMQRKCKRTIKLKYKKRKVDA